MNETARSNPRNRVAIALVLAGVVLVALRCGSGRQDDPAGTMEILRTAEAFHEILNDADSRREHPDAPIRQTSFETTTKKNAGKLYLGGERPALLMAPEAEITWALPIPENATLSFAAGIASESQELEPKIRFEVVVGDRTVFDRTLDPAAAAPDRDWVLHEEPLPFSDEQPVPITFRTSLIGPEGIDAASLVCGFGTPQITTKDRVARTKPSKDRPNLLYICVDTVRADHLSCYGHDRPTSPNVDALAAEGIRYATPVSPSPWTWPSTASLLTGLYPYTHGVIWHDECYLPSKAETIAEALQRAGITTYAISANPLVCKPQNFDQGFEVFEEAFQERADVLTDRFLNWLDDQEGHRFFAYLHYFDPHYTYDPPEGLRYVEEVLQREVTPQERPQFEEMRAKQKGGVNAYRGRDDRASILTALYDAEIRFFDEQIGRLRAALEERGVLENTIVVLTSDHGEEFFDHGRVGHSLTLHDELTVVPLIVHYPARLSPAVVQDQAETVSLSPTLLELLGVDVPKGMVEHRLPLGEAAGVSRPGFSTTERWIDPEQAFRRRQNSIREPGWKLIHVPESEGDDKRKPGALWPETLRLFRLTDDPGEQTDVAAAHPGEVLRLRSELDKWVFDTQSKKLKTGGSQALSESMLKRLEEQGYLERGNEKDDTEGEH